MQPTQKSAINEGLLIAMLAAINFTHIMDFVIMAPLSATLKIAMSITTKEFGYLVSIYTFAAAVGAIIAFFKIDKYDRRTAIIFVYTGFIVANILCALAPQYKFFMLARLFAGLFGGVLNVLIMSVIGDVIPLERRGKATGMVMAAFSAASVIGIPSGLILADIFKDYHAPFWLLSILSALVGFVLVFKFPSIKSHMEFEGAKTPPMEIIKEYMQNSNVRRALLFIFLLMIAGFSVVPFISDYLVNNVGLDLKELKYVYLCGGLATVASSIFIGRLSDKLGKVKTFIIAALVSVAPIAIVTVLPVMPLKHVLLFNVLFFMCFGARFVPAMTLMTSCVQPKRRGSFLSVSSAIQQLGSGVAVLIASAIIVNGPKGELHNFGWVGIVACVATVISILLSVRIKEVS
ncbi:MFS transporter [Cytophaga hutchinsonii]|jgi:predicted MFS family arabinose efflux permease|uniref:Sugar efflux transporter n=1 Tax=Cytophaga hutchinsonii (strain ATCC 33406 / DSM 1761 / CIP 103989 / NBRC 15051 / NCIMB 9469 / D465) TaxID=269798 RepID=A0A6N4SMW8_CYTH3|nr:MFS transporter [Cytophaga hutchinsonii]ABG57615.1 sugar efflux transporter [Cytophaga hutchinsonii ATCC 33406]SFX01195.1 Predicted arabinose efflux permease, MFS family [Cytophaga hutchinsonii ATCC 33406]